MSLILNFIIGFIAALIGVIPPGLLNMSAVKISIKEGRKKAFLFSVGVSCTVLIQTYIALIGARYLDSHPDVIKILQKVGLGIFICLTLYFLFIAKDTRREIPEDTTKSKTNRFFKGMMIAALNLLPLPYWVYIGVTFAGFGWFSFEQSGLLAATIGSALGTLAMLGLYIQFFKRKDDKPRVQANMNLVIGLITAVIAIITAFKIFTSV
jgi:threonine/homoserine/homoserine lactone efflux protein